MKATTALLEMVECHGPGSRGLEGRADWSPLISASPLHHQLSAEMNLLVFLQSRYQEVIHADLSSLAPSHQSLFLSHALTALMRMESERTAIYSNELKERIPTLRYPSDPAPAWIQSRLRGLYPTQGQAEGGMEWDDDVTLMEGPSSKQIDDWFGAPPSLPLVPLPHANGQKRRREREGEGATAGENGMGWAVKGPQAVGLRCPGVARTSARPAVQRPVRTCPSPSSASPSSSSSPLTVSSHVSSPSVHWPPLPLFPPPPHSGGLPLLILPPPLTGVSADISLPRRTPSILASPSISPHPSPTSPPHPRSSVPSNSSSPSIRPLPPLPLAQHHFFLLPPLRRDSHTRARTEAVVAFPQRWEALYELPHAKGFHLHCLSSTKCHNPLVKDAQRLLKGQFNSCGDSTSGVYYLVLTSPFPAIPVICASYFLVKDQPQKGGAVIDLMALMTVGEMRGLGFGSVFYEAHREVAGRVAVCREWRGMDRKCDLVVHSIEQQMGWWRRMGCDYMGRREGMKEDGVGFPNTFAMIDRGRQRTDADLTQLVQHMARFSPDLAAWGGEN